tara:strand:+ start:1468 stop:3000 length:1533 start_codon:yes stop_codon:yes gene_type:complete
MPLNADSIILGPWHGGVRYDIPVEEAKAHELSDMGNTRIGTGGQVITRPGTDSFNDLLPVNSAAALLMCAEYNVTAETTQTVIVAGNKIYDYSSNVWTDRTNGLTVTVASDNTFEWADANGTLVATNGVDVNAFKMSGGVATALDDNSRFSKGKHIAWFDNRLWIGNVDGATSQLWYSDTADIETWGGTSFFNFGGYITGLQATQNALTVHTSDGIYTLYPTGNATIPYNPQKETERAGIDGRSIATLPDDLQVMVLSDGIYEWRGGATLEKVSNALDGGYWPLLDLDRLHKAHAVRFPKESEIWFFLPFKGENSSQAAMNNIMVYNYRKRTTVNGRDVGTWHGPYDGFERNCSALINNKVHAGDFGGQLLDHDDNDNSDQGVAIAATFTTGAPAPLGADVKVRWLNGRYFYDGEGNYEIDVFQEGTDVEGTAEKLDMIGEGFILDVSLLDITELRGIDQLVQDLGLQGYTPECSVRFSHGVNNQPFTIRRCVLRYKPLGRFTKPKPVDL